MIRLKKLSILLFLLLISTITGYSQSDTVQGPITIGGVDFDFTRPKSFEIGPIRVEGADNYDHNAIKLLAGLRQGQSITIPGEQVSKAINNLWNEGIFSNVEILAEKEMAGVIYLVIKVEPRPKLSRCKFNGGTRRDADKIREEIRRYGDVCYFIID